jgi:methylmalonic aciduria homocystinuria type C protein
VTAIDTLRRELGPRGLDILYPFSVDASLDDLFVFPRFDEPARLGVLIGNSRALWAPFTAWVKREPAPSAHPLHDYVKAALVPAQGALGVPHYLYFAERLDYDAGGGKRSAVPLQRLGSRVGLASLGPAHLSVHPEYGPWFAYRAALVLDLPPPATPDTPRTEPCASCPAPCKGALDLALGPEHSLAVERNWQRWLAVRDACPERSDARYSDAQIGYHYTKDPRFLGRNA